MTIAHIPGFPRIGAQRELKAALDAYWKGTLPDAELLAVARDLRLRHWALQPWPRDELQSWETTLRTSYFPWATYGRTFPVQETTTTMQGMRFANP